MSVHFLIADLCHYENSKLQAQIIREKNLLTLFHYSSTFSQTRFGEMLLLLSALLGPVKNAIIVNLLKSSKSDPIDEAIFMIK